MKPAAVIHDYAIEQTNRLLTTLASQIRRAAKRPGPDEIHDLRVSIRRFTEGLRLFAEFFPKSQAKKIRVMLRRMLRLTSDLRNRDIALEFLGKSPAAEHRKRLKKERADYQRRFSEMVRHWSARDFSAQWRDGLALGLA